LNQAYIYNKQIKRNGTDSNIEIYYSYITTRAHYHRGDVEIFAR